MRMKNKLLSMLMVLVLCLGMFSTTALAYTGDEAEAETESADVQDVTEDAESSDTEIPYQFSIADDGSFVFSYNGKEWTFTDDDAGDSSKGGKVVTGGSRLNVRTGAGLDYEVIDQLRPGEMVSVIGVSGDWYQVTIPEKTGYVYSDYLEVLETAGDNNTLDKELLEFFMVMLMQNMNTGTGSAALSPDGNLTLVDDVGSPTGEGKQFITLVTKNGNYFYLIIDRDDKGEQTVHFLNLVDEADLLSLMEEEEAAKYASILEEPGKEPEPEKTTEPEITAEPEPEKKESPNMLPALMVLVLLIAGGGFFAFKKLKTVKKEEQAKPDPDADYVDDDEDYGYEESEEDTDYDDDEEDSSMDEDDNEPV